MALTNSWGFSDEVPADLLLWGTLRAPLCSPHVPVGFLSPYRGQFLFKGSENEIWAEMDAWKGFCDEL